MEHTLSEKTYAIASTLVNETVEASKDYAVEKISSEQKRENIESSLTIANLRIKTAIQKTFDQVVEKLKNERHITPRLVKDTLNELL